MKFALKTKRSGGIRVTASVHRLIALGNVARDDARWIDAADAFRQALMLAPELGHIHIQHGHALKESGRPDEADVAYAEAMRLRPDDADPLIHRVHLTAHRSGQHVAARMLVGAFKRHPTYAGSKELIGLLDPIVTRDPALLQHVINEGNIKAFSSSQPPKVVGGTAPQIFDITDLIGHFRHQRLPNGIERVQIEILQKALDQYGDDRIGICCFISMRDTWVGVQPSLFRDMASLATAGSDPEDPSWQLARIRLFLNLALADDYVMPVNAILLNLGTAWWAHDYFRHIRNAKYESSIRYIAMVYDLIPILAPQYCLPDISRDFVSWIIGALRHADGFLVISNYSRNTLLHVAKQLGRPLTTDQVEVIPLDADFRHAVDPLPTTELATWSLTGAPFALLVSTIEPRKNHALALDTWSVLLRRHGPDKVPRLVCVGRDGWLNDPVFARLKLDPLLATHVTLIHRVSDEELALLYRSCRFSVYPSLYEGWGLPVTEALSYGRVAIIADSSSLPEAGDGFALLFASGSLEALTAAVEQVAFDDCWREEREAAITARFSPRSWAQVAGQVDRAVTRLLTTVEPSMIVPAVEHGRYYPTILHHGDRLPLYPAGGEDVRAGKGWLWPEPDGCRTGPNGGEVRLRVAGKTKLRFHLRLRGLAAVDCPVSVIANGVEIVRASIPAGKIRWLTCDLPGPNVAFLLRGEATEVVGMPNGPRIASVTLLGLLPAATDISPEALLKKIDQASWSSHA